MTPSPSRSTVSAVPAALLIAAVIALGGLLYGDLYARSAAQLEQARSINGRVAWIAHAEPQWRNDYKSVLSELRENPSVIVSDRPQEAAGWLQSQIRQALMAAGATVDSLQGAAGAAAEGKLPALRAVVTARTNPDHILDILRSIERIDPPIAVESLDIATQQIGTKDSLERIALLTIAVRAYVLPRQNDLD